MQTSTRKRGFVARCVQTSFCFLNLSKGMLEILYPGDMDLASEINLWSSFATCRIVVDYHDYFSIP
jgi:hypothetical protein